MIMHSPFVSRFYSLISRRDRFRVRARAGATAEWAVRLIRCRLIVAAILTTCWLVPAYDVRAVNAASATIDLTKAVVVAPGDLSAREKKAVAMLVDEVAKRTQIHWPVATEWPKAPGTPII